MADFSHNSAKAFEQQRKESELLGELGFVDAVGMGARLQYSPDRDAWGGFFDHDGPAGVETVAIDCRGELHFSRAGYLVDLSGFGFKKLVQEPELG